MRLILASSSKRRRQLLAEAGYDLRVIEPSITEPKSLLAKLSPRHQAEALAYFKARSVADGNPDGRVVAADTVVAVEARILGKPSGRNHAEQMLRSLSSTRHQVITGVALLWPGGRRLIASDVTYVTMRRLSDDEIRDYLDSEEWAGKAGAYAIQETADRFVQSIEGSFTNVVGLPMELLQRMIEHIAGERSTGKKGR